MCHTLWRVCCSSRSGVPPGESAVLADPSRFLASPSHTDKSVALSGGKSADLSSCLRNLLHSLQNLLCSGSLCGEPVALSAKSAALADLSHFSVDLLHSGSLCDESSHPLCCQRVFHCKSRSCVQQWYSWYIPQDPACI